jgi:hypothetical protein
LKRPIPLVRRLACLCAGIVGAAALTTASLPAAQADGSATLGLKVLLIGTASDPTTSAWSSELGREGVPFSLITPTAPVDTASLVDPNDSSHGYYNGVVLANDSSNYWGLLDNVYAYERQFGVRQLDGYEFPRQQVDLVGLDDTTYDHSFAATSVSLTPAGRTTFPYLKGALKIDAGTYGYLSTPVDANFTPAVTVTGTNNTLLGVYRHPADLSGTDPKATVEEMVMTVNYNDAMMQWRLLSRGMVDWVTRGAHLGFVRSFLANEVDDVLIPDDTWNSTRKCTPSGDITTDCRTAAGAIDANAAPVDVRATAADVNYVLDWQKRLNFQLDLAFNGSGAATKDPLTTALVANRKSFGWVNHTWDHPYLGCTAYVTAGDPTSGCATWYPLASIVSEIKQNQDWAKDNGLQQAGGFSKSELVTGEHSGLDNPNMAAALAKTGITVVADDASRRPAQWTLGQSMTSPRYPSNVYYNAATWAQELDEYNWIYTDPAHGGGCVATATTTCRTSPASQAEYLASETSIMLGHVLSNDPRPGYSHQTNLIGPDHLILTLLSEVLTQYRSYFNTNAPLVTPSLTDSATELHYRGLFNSALAAGQVTGSVHSGVVTITSSAGTALTAGATLPTTATVTGTTSPALAGYGGARSGWFTLPANGSASFTL